MFNTPPNTTNQPANHRTDTPKRRSKSSGIVITPARRNGPITKPEAPTKYIAKAMINPTTAPAKPFSNPSWAVYMIVTKPNSVAANDAIPRFKSICRAATAKSSTPRTNRRMANPAAMHPTRYTPTIAQSNPCRLMTLHPQPSPALEARKPLRRPDSRSSLQPVSGCSALGLAALALVSSRADSGPLTPAVATANLDAPNRHLCNSPPRHGAPATLARLQSDRGVLTHPHKLDKNTGSTL